MFAYCKWIYAIISKRGNAMKSRIIKRLICALLAAVMMIMCSMPAFALHNYASSYIIDVHLENAPEEAAYADILVPALKVQEYTDYHETKITNYDKSIADIDKNSEIVNYIDDEGFISLSAHTQTVQHIDLQIFHSSRIGGRIIAGRIRLKKDNDEHDAGWLKRNYEELKIAFVDKNGKVISVTDKASFHTVDDQEYPEMTSSGGSELKFGTHKYVSGFEAIMTLLLILLAFAAIIAFSIALVYAILKATIQGLIEKRKHQKEI